MKRRLLLTGAGALGAMAVTRSSLESTAHDYFVPAEEEPHERTFMQWPVSRKVYYSKAYLRWAQEAIANIANTISEFEPVTMLASREFHEDALRKLSSKVELWDIPTEDLWCRDSGPIFGVNQKGDRAVIGVQFNGWGEKQENRHDSRIAVQVAKRLDLPLRPSGLIGEGGGVEQDGHGLLLAHASSWVNDNRNPGLTKRRVEDRLLAAYGADRMVWSDGLWGEDITDYHIDSLARFTGPGRVLMNLPEQPDPRDSFHNAALRTRERLQDAGLEIEVIPEPNRPRVRTSDFVASYVNYYACNGAIVAPHFGDRRTDDIAVDAFGRHYPGREIVTLNTDFLGELGGGIHCAKQQMPAVR